MTYKVVLDACVIYPDFLRDLLLSVAAEGAYQPFWSQDIHDEWQRKLLKNRPDLSLEQISGVAATMNQFFSGAYQNGFHHLINALNLPDPNDEHVLALAIYTKAQYIVTENLRDFPVSKLSKHGLTAINSDSFLSKLCNSFDLLVHRGLKELRIRRVKPLQTPEEFLTTLQSHGLTQFGSCLDPKKL